MNAALFGAAALPAQVGVIDLDPAGELAAVLTQAHDDATPRTARHAGVAFANQGNS